MSTSQTWEIVYIEKRHWIKEKKIDVSPCLRCYGHKKGIRMSDWLVMKMLLSLKNTNFLIIFHYKSLQPISIPASISPASSFIPSYPHYLTSSVRQMYLLLRCCTRSRHAPTAWCRRIYAGLLVLFGLRQVLKLWHHHCKYNL